MKNILTPIVALFLSLQLHAAVQTVKFVDANGKEPQEQAYDQHCSLVNCADNTVIPDNNITLAVGDELAIKMPRSHSLFSNYHYAINEGTSADILNLHAIHITDSETNDNCFSKISLVALAPGVEELNIHFTEEVNYFTAGYSPVKKLLAHVTVTIVE